MEWLDSANHGETRGIQTWGGKNMTDVAIKHEINQQVIGGPMAVTISPRSWSFGTITRRLWLCAHTNFMQTRINQAYFRRGTLRNWKPPMNSDFNGKIIYTVNVNGGFSIATFDSRKANYCRVLRTKWAIKWAMWALSHLIRVGWKHMKTASQGSSLSS